MCNLCEIYKKEIEIFLGTMGVVKGDKIINTDTTLNKENAKFIKEKMLQLKSNNCDEKILDKAIEELLPYLCENN